MDDDDLRESLLDLFEEAPCGYIFTRPDGTFTRANGTFLDWSGYSREDLLNGKRFQDLLTVPGKIFYENQFFPLLRMQGFVREVAFDIAGKEGEKLPVLVNSVLKTAEDGQPTMIASALFLASDRRAYEQEILHAQQEAEQLSAIVRLSADAITRCSAVGLMETWNAGTRDMFRFGEHEIRGMHLRHLLPSIDDEEWRRMLGALASGEAVRFEAVGRRADGSSIDVSVGLAPHVGPLGELTAMSAIMRDITESKEIQRLQNEFLAMISHELGTPLTAIRGHAQLMLRRGVYAQAQLETIVSATDQLGRLIEDLLLASRLEADRFDLRPAELDLVGVVRATVDNIAGASGRTIHLEAPDERVPVWGDRLRLGQVFTNLLSNAVKYSAAGTDITVRITDSDLEARVAVIDRGVGIPAEDIPHLFSRFYRVASAREGAQGVGLGLYIADRLIHAHGGRLMVASEVGSGSTFTVSLPRQRDVTSDSEGGVPL